MEKLKYKKGQDIIKQGDEGDLFYVVEEGECEIYVEGERHALGLLCVYPSLTPLTDIHILPAHHCHPP